MSNYFKLLRTKHWIKNLFLFSAPFFGGHLFSREVLHIAFPTFLAFSFAASAVYAYNDVRDIESDKLHPKKRKRPVASGSVSKRGAYLSSVILLVISLALSYWISVSFLLLVILYVLIHIAYSSFLKNIPLLDIFCIASGFVIRVLAGGAAFHTGVSNWLLLTMFMISLVLAAGKRLGEVKLLSEGAESHRKSLNMYSISTLNEILVISSAASLISYSLYTIEQSQHLAYTIPIVTFGLFRYLMLSKQGSGDPTDAMIGDKWLALTVTAWLLLIGLIRYNQ